MHRCRQALRLDSAFWRRLAWLGAARGPRVWLRYSPPAIGLIAALAAPQQRSQVHRNLRRMFGRRRAPLEVLDVARTFMSFACSLADSLAVADGSRYQPHVEVEGELALQQALEAGRGLILVTAHTAGWEIALGELRKRTTRPVAVVMQRERDMQARLFHGAVRAGNGATVVESGTDPRASVLLLGHLRKQGLVAVQIDRCPPGMRHCEVRVFGREWRVPEGPFALAAATGAPIVAVFASRVGFLHYRLKISDAIRVRPKALDEAAQRVGWELDRFVRQNPTQWFHFNP